MSSRNGLVIALLLSAALNLLIAGVLLGRWTRGEAPQPPPLQWTARDLAPETRQQVRDRLQERMTDVRPLRAEMREASAAVRRAAVAEPFDASALRQALAELRRIQQQYQGVMHDSVVDIAAELPREQRLALLRQALERGGRGDRGDSRERPQGPRPPG
jgi:uncharacterized membrane protein